MARTLNLFQEPPRPCTYLPEEQASLEHRFMVDVTPEELEALLRRGFRRFGPNYFRPKCDPCGKCLSTRVSTALFRPNQSQKRARKKCASLDISVGVPAFDEERLALYHRWHENREAARQWDESSLSERAYRLQFAYPHPAAREISFRESDTGRLVGVALSDQTPNAWSAIYFFYCPSWAKHSIGTANVVFQLEHAKSLGIPYVYLGYRVEGCASLAYKGHFQPQEAVVGRPDEDDEPQWELVTSPPHRGD